MRLLAKLTAGPTSRAPDDNSASAKWGSFAEPHKKLSIMLYLTAGAASISHVLLTIFYFLVFLSQDFATERNPSLDPFIVQ